jgi:hypothetical protein
MVLMRSSLFDALRGNAPHNEQVIKDCTTGKLAGAGPQGIPIRLGMAGESGLIGTNRGGHTRRTAMMAPAPPMNLTPHSNEGIGATKPAGVNSFFAFLWIALPRTSPNSERWWWRVHSQITPKSSAALGGEGSARG